MTEQNSDSTLPEISGGAAPAAAVPASREVLDSGGLPPQTPAGPGDGGDGGDGPRRRRPLLLGASAAAAVALVAGGVFAYTALSGGGTQPEDVLPATAFAFAKVDLDPSAGQKLAFARLAQKFPEATRNEDTKDLEDGDLRATLLRSFFKDEGVTATWKGDLEPWVGQRIGVAASAGAKSEVSTAGLNYVMAIAVTDQDKARSWLTKAAARSKARDKALTFALVDGYALVAPEQDDLDQATSAVKAGRTLATKADFTNDYAGLDKDQLAAAWVDAGAAYDAAKHVAEDKAPDGMPLDLSKLGRATMTGRFVLGLHAASDYLELQGRGHGLSGSASGISLPATALQADGATSLAGAAPADAAAAFSLSGLDKIMKDLYPQLAKLDDTAPQQAKAYGLNLPADFTALLGTDTGVFTTGGPDSWQEHGALMTKGGDPARVSELSRLITGTALASVTDGDVSYYAADAGALPASNGRHLEDTASFRKAVPDADGAAVVLYVNLAKVTTGEKAATELRNADAFGATVNRTGQDATFRLRLTVR